MENIETSFEDKKNIFKRKDRNVNHEIYSVTVPFLQQYLVVFHVEQCESLKIFHCTEIKFVINDDCVDILDTNAAETIYHDI